MARARLILRRKWTDERGNLYEIVMWQVDRSSRYPEGVRCRLAFIRAGNPEPALLYDNHHPKGHHRHFGANQEAYTFTTARRLIEDFLKQSAGLSRGKTSI